MLTEVPLITEEHNAFAVRYKVNNDLSFTKCKRPGGNEPSPFFDGNKDEWQSRVEGCAATHHHNQVIIRTAACAEEPYILSVVKVHGTEMTMVEFDLAHLDANMMRDVIKTIIFHEKTAEMDGEMEITSSEECVKILMVDSQANVISIDLKYETFVPISAQHIATRPILSSHNIHPHNRSSITSTQVVAVDSKRLVFAVTPFILCLNLSNHKVSAWSKESCLFNRRKSFSGVFRSAKGILVGKSGDDAQEEFVEESSNMASTAALCVFNQASSYAADADDDDDEKYPSGKVVCSLHSDGIVRMWTLSMNNQSFTYPKQMHILYGVEDIQGGAQLPLPHMWSSSNDSLLIDGRCDTTNNGEFNFVVIVGIRIAETVGASRTCSPLHLTTLSGEIGSSFSSIVRSALEVPDVVDSMKAVDFVKAQNGWELRSLFSCFPRQTHGESIYASFCNNPERKAMVAIYESNSVTPSHLLSSNSLDSFAEKERENIIHHCNLVVKNELFHWDCGGVDEIDAIFRQLDGWFLQRIFRSGAVQSVGMERATDGSIRRALRQVIPPLCFDNESQRELSMKCVEVETAIMMRKWSKFDEARSRSHDGQTGSKGPHLPSRSHTGPIGVSSIYSDFCKTMDTRQSSTPEIRDDSDDDEISMHSHSTTRKIQEHQLRWKKLLLAISHEEAQLLSPIGFLSLPESESAMNVVLLRAGITTTIASSNASGCTTTLSKLDSIMSSMLDRIEITPNANTELLAGLEAKVWQTISKANLLYADDVHGLIGLVNNVVSDIDVVGWDGFYSKLLIVLNTLTEKEVKAWLSSPLDSNLRHSNGDVEMDTQGSDSNLYSVAIPSAVRLTKQYVSSCRRLALARYVSIIGLGVNGYALFTADQERTSLLTYLHTVGVAWACVQTIAHGSSFTKTPRQVAFNSSEGQLTSRPSTASLCTETEKTSLLYSVLSQILKAASTVSSPSASMLTIQASKGFVHLAFIQDSEGFPELSIVQPEYSTDACRISLRLLAPTVAFPANDPLSKSRRRKAADCLLTEVFMLVKENSLTLQKATEAQDHASILLKSCTSVRSDQKSMQIFLNTLNDLPEQTIATEIASDNFFNKATVDVIQDIFDKTSIPVQYDDITCVAKMDKVKILLRPWVIASYNEKSSTVSMILDSLGKSTEDPISILRHSANVLLLVSNLVERVKVLERHSAMVAHPSLKGSFAKVLNTAVNDVIEEVQNHVNATDYDLMIEYPALWSAIFRYALQGQCWEDAFEACLSNPVKERQKNNFRRLVLSMVDAGGTGLLLDKMIFFVVNGKDSGKGMDLYEVAAGALVEASQRAASDVAFGRFASVKVDYRGCVYALHAAYGDWRRSCQALDFFGALTLLRVPYGDDVEHASSPETKAADRHIMDELVLAAVSSAQLIQLVSNPDQRYIVSGELTAAQALGWSSKSINASEVDHLIDGSKPCGESEAMDVDYFHSDNAMHRLSRLYTAKDLLLRAKRMVALQTLQNDALSPDNLLDILHSSDTAIIDALPRLGYFDHAISFSHCKKENKEGAKPQGRDVFFDAMSHMLCKCLAPVAVTLSKPLVDKTQILNDLELQTRPTIDHLRLLTGDGRLSRPHESWQSEGSLDSAQRGAFAMELLRLYTETFAAKESSIAIDLAEAFLDLDGGRAKLPCWLTSLIMGDRHFTDTSGLFDKSDGNPTALLNLYIKYGMYIDGCELVTSILLGDENARRQAAPSRLPERGSIDFVPYEKIDILWNTIESCLRHLQERDAKSKLLRSRSAMEYALHKHFQLMKVSEQGMLSARALQGR